MGAIIIASPTGQHTNWGIIILFGSGPLGGGGNHPAWPPHDPAWAGFCVIATLYINALCIALQLIL